MAWWFLRRAAAEAGVYLTFPKLRWLLALSQAEWNRRHGRPLFRVAQGSCAFCPAFPSAEARSAGDEWMHHLRISEAEPDPAVAGFLEEVYGRYAGIPARTLDAGLLVKGGFHCLHAEAEAGAPGTDRVAP